MGIILRIFANGLMSGWSYTPLKHQETDWPVGGGNQEHGIHPGGMVGRQQRSAARGNVFLARQIEAVDRVCGDPQQQPQQGIGQEPQEICECPQRQNRGPEENVRRAQPQAVLEQVKRAGCAKDADERIEICGSQDAAAVLLFRAMLDQCTDRHDEEAAGETERGEEKEHCVEGKTGNCQQKAKQRDACRAEGNQAVLNFSAGKISGREAAQSDADGDCGLQQAAVSCGDVEDVACIEDDVELEQRAEEEEIGVPEDREPQNLVPPDEFALRP
jgi:hypothetical protein